MRVHDKGMSVRQKKSNEDKDEPLYKNCRLFIFVCMLVKCKDIDIDEEIDIVEINYRAIRIVYFNEMKNQCKVADNNTFVTWVRNVGEIALEFLKEGTKAGKRSEFMKLFGPEVFNSGILHDGRRKHYLLDTNEYVFPTFADITTQEFLAAFRYKKNIESTISDICDFDVKELLLDSKKMFSDFILIDMSPTFHMFLEILKQGEQSVRQHLQPTAADPRLETLKVLAKGIIFFYLENKNTHN